ncbi:hypothetical protein T492DRAFT_976852 [Pavlovales sp. CCMP2436]|nr:hypothetical protein T492DRAFT_976852 [Pavlovales sp. CCMP2436]
MVDLQGSLVSKQPLTFHVIVVNGRQGHLADSHRFTSRGCYLRPQGPHAQSVVKTTIQATYCMYSAHVACKGSPARSPRRAGLGQLSTQARPALVHAHHVREHSTRPSPFVDFKAGTNPLSRAAYLPRDLEHPHRRPAGLIIQRRLLAHLGQGSSPCPRHHTRSSLNALPTFINAQPFPTRSPLRAPAALTRCRCTARARCATPRGTSPVRARALHRQDAAVDNSTGYNAAVDISIGKTPLVNNSTGLPSLSTSSPARRRPPSSAKRRRRQLHRLHRRRRHLLRLPAAHHRCFPLRKGGGFLIK